MIQYKFSDRREGVIQLKAMGFHAEDKFNVSYVFPDELPLNYPLIGRSSLPKALGGLEPDGNLVLYEDTDDPVIYEYQSKMKKSLGLTASDSFPVQNK